MALTLQTARLTLRPQDAGDIPANLAGLNDFDVARWLTVVPFPYTQADAEEWIARQVPPVPGHAVFAIDLPGAGMIGAVTLVDQLGYWLDSRFHGHGYATEASAALLDWHFAHRPDTVVASGIHTGNTASWRVQEKLGFVETGPRRMAYALSQQRDIEHIGTTLTRPAFEAARARWRQ